VKNPPAIKGNATAFPGWGVFLCLLSIVILFAHVPQARAAGFTFVPSTLTSTAGGTSLQSIDPGGGGDGFMWYNSDGTRVSNAGGAGNYTQSLTAWGFTTVTNCSELHFIRRYSGDASWGAHEADNYPDVLAYGLYVAGSDGFAIVDDGTCGDPEPVYGCTDPDADNYDPLADTDDGSCTYPGDGGLTASSTEQIMRGIGDITFGLALIIFLLSIPFWKMMLRYFFGGEDFSHTSL